MAIIDPICLIDERNTAIFHGKERGASGPRHSKPQEIVMSIRSTLLAAAFALAAVGPAHADGVRPVEARSIELGEVAGVAYYTIERDGFRVVTTLTHGEAGTPVRVVAVLAPGQSVVLSTPRDAGAAPAAVEISRQADTVLVRKTAAVTN
jgi:hypothetical protein